MQQTNFDVAMSVKDACAETPCMLAAAQFFPLAFIQWNYKPSVASAILDEIRLNEHNTLLLCTVNVTVALQGSKQ